MKIILFSPLPPPIGGMAIWTKSYIDYFKESDITIDLINTAVLGHNVEYSGLKSEIIREWKILLSCYKKRKEKNAVVHFNSSGNKYGIIRDYLALQLLKNDSKKIIIHFHCDLGEQKYSYISSYFLKRMLETGDCILVLNESSKEIIEKLGYTSCIVNNFVNDKELECYIKNDFNNCIKDICYIGRFNEDKGSKEFLEISRRMPEINFHVYGPVECNVNQDEYNNVEFTGSLNRNELFMRVSKCDLFLFLSKHEGSPLSIIEAGFIELPIITTDVGNVRKLLCHESIIDKYDTEEVINKIKTFNDVNKRKVAVNKNKEKCKEFTISKVSKRLFEIYRSANHKKQEKFH